MLIILRFLLLFIKRFKENSFKVTTCYLAQQKGNPLFYRLALGCWYQQVLMAAKRKCPFSPDDGDKVEVYELRPGELQHAWVPGRTVPSPNPAKMPTIERGQGIAHGTFVFVKYSAWSEAFSGLTSDIYL